MLLKVAHALKRGGGGVGDDSCSGDGGVRGGGGGGSGGGGDSVVVTGALLKARVDEGIWMVVVLGICWLGGRGHISYIIGS